MIDLLTANAIFAKVMKLIVAASFIEPASSFTDRIAVGNSVEDDVLIKRRWLVLDALDQETYFDIQLIKNISGFEIRALDSDDRWISYWPKQGMPITELPRVLEVELKIPGMGTVKRLLELMP